MDAKNGNVAGNAASIQIEKIILCCFFGLEGSRFGDPRPKQKGKAQYMDPDGCTCTSSAGPAVKGRKLVSAAGEGSYTRGERRSRTAKVNAHSHAPESAEVEVRRERVEEKNVRESRVHQRQSCDNHRRGLSIGIRLRYLCVETVGTHTENPQSEAQEYPCRGGL